MNQVMKLSLLCFNFLIFCISLYGKEPPLRQSRFLTALIPNISVNSFDSYSDFGKYAYSYAPAIGIDAEFSKSRQWKFTGKLNYCPVPYWIPIEIGIGAKDIKKFKSLPNMLYYFGVGLNYKMFLYNGGSDIYGYKYPDQFEPPFYHELNKGDFSQTFGAELYYGVNYLIGEKYFFDLRFGYKAYLPHLDSDFKTINIYNIPNKKVLKYEDDYLNPMDFYIKLGFGIILGKVSRN
jgi:hypothetical protein